MESQERTQHAEEELWEQIFSRENLFAALEQVQRNNGAPGIDGMTVKELPDHLVRHWEGIRAKLDKGTYVPSPVKRVSIPKPDGGERQLGIPTVLDRMIQQAMQQVLSPIFEETFSAHSYGFRPGRSAHDAVKAARDYIEEGYRYVVDIDLKKFFDQVNHDRLMARMKLTVKDKRVLRLVNAYLKAGVMVDGVQMTTEEGTPQGGPLSPLLSNIVLTELDRQLEERGHCFVRYADDCNIYVKSQRSAERVLRSTTGYIERRMRLKVNTEKSAAGPVGQRTFLGFSFYWRAGKPHIRIAPKSLERVKRRIRRITRRNSGCSLEMIRDEINRYITGWVNYYALADGRDHMARLDRWIRRRMRQICWKQWKTPQNRRENLLKLGVPEKWAKMSAGTSLGEWCMSKSPWLHRALNNKYWYDFGLKSFLQQYNLRHT
jgi:group II intron reverse transcriptase/maturase